MPLTYRLFILALVAILPALAAIAYNEHDLRVTREAETREQAIAAARLAAYEIDRIVLGLEQLYIAIGQTEGVQRLDGPACSGYLAALVPQEPHLLRIGILDGDGRLRCASAGEGGDFDYGDRSYLRDALGGRSLVVGHYAVDRPTGQPTLPVAMPLTLAGGARAVIVGAINLSWFGARIAERGIPDGGALTIADSRGTIIARNPLPEQFVGTRIPEPFLRLVRADRPGAEVVLSQDGTRRILGYFPPAIPPGRGFYVSAGLSEEQAAAPISRAFQRGLALAMLGVIVAVASAWAAGHYFVRRPVTRILRTIDAWRGGDGKARTGMVRQGDELAAIGAEIDQLMDEVAARQHHQQLLINELNHRVKNTLATVQAIALLTLKDDVPVADSREAFQSRLVALAQTHDVLTRENWQQADLATVVEQTVAPYVRPGANQFQLGGPAVAMPPRMALALSMAIHELCTNAAKYGALSCAEGTVTVAWTAEETQDGTLLRLDWREAGGPPVMPPVRTGFGTRLISRQLARELNGTVDLDFAPAGLACRVACLLPADFALEAGPLLPAGAG
ncbi:sensor histidine kinase [Azospirillum thermophilum]|uniref:histidine kinase n=1 Tax=Azospirillum thermophilum TaxID=2202148 RepID=A0A2S2CYI5_9PROT|nr:sensor histidine kinase [Azospirillum thermophilum]AWK89485.1 histidine kinase [Azospirillum thermophilum]